MYLQEKFSYSTAIIKKYFNQIFCLLNVFHLLKLPLFKLTLFLETITRKINSFTSFGNLKV